MNKYRSYHFLINPVSGSARNDWIQLISAYKNPELDFRFCVWKNADDKDVLKRELEDSDAEVLVAVGGDGTINLLGEIAMKTNKVLGIIPSGSGNGLARHLNLPLKPGKAISHLLSSQVRNLDVAFVNGKHFLCCAGIGFDALIGKEFASRETTGLWGYIKISLTHVFSYKPEIYTLNLSDSIVEKEAFLITFANGSQYGNNAVIAPGASTEDGQLNICILKPFPLYKAIPLTFRLFTRTINKSSLLETIKTDKLIIKRNPGPVHLDGDPYEMNGELKVEVSAKRVKVLR